MDNRFTSLPEIDTNIDIEKDEEELKSQECNKMDNTTRKRQLDKTPPNSTKQSCKKINNPPISPKAKVQKQNTKSNIPLSPIVTIIPLGAESQNSGEMENQHTDNYDESKEIHPSPIIGTTRKTKKEQQTNEHEDTCGCSKCFVAMCHKNKTITKESLTNTIRNFMRYRNKEKTNIKSHEEGCMCIEHLEYYKEKHISVVDNILKKIKMEKLNQDSKNVTVNESQNKTTTKNESRPTKIQINL